MRRGSWPIRGASVAQVSAEPPVAPPPEADAPSQRFRLKGRSVREHTARGTIINAVFLVSVAALGLLRGFLLARFLTAEDYGIWGVLLVSLGTLLWLKQAGIGDKYIQQDDEDQEAAFHKAFTLELAFAGIFTLLLAAVVPILSVALDRPELIAPGLAMCALVPALALQAPLWIHYRRMDFFRQRVLQSVDPVVGLVVSLSLAIAGAGYWAFVVGVLAGTWSAALVAVRFSPYRLALRYDHGTLRTYASFSWPLLAASVGGIVIAQGSILVTTVHLGIAAAGAVTLAASISQFSDRVDQIVSGTLYPAICSVADRTELLLETFTKANRLALMWAMPFGIGMALFAEALVDHALGAKWEPAIILIQFFGITVAFGQLAFNWDSYFRARGTTRPIAVANGIAVVAFLAITVPLILADGLRGFAIGTLVQTLVLVACRFVYLRRLFGPALHIPAFVVRATAPVVPGTALVLALRAGEVTGTGGAAALAELALFAAVTAVATAMLERALLREALGYLRAKRVATA